MISWSLSGSSSTQKSRSALDWCLRQHGASWRADLVPEEKRKKKTSRNFKDYTGKETHMPISSICPKYRMRRSVNISLSSSIAPPAGSIEIRESKSAASAAAFLRNLLDKAPSEIKIILTDNGKEFTDRFCAKGQRKPTGNHSFDTVCQEHQIEHRLIRPRHPQTNGIIERFNARIKKIVTQSRFNQQTI